MPSRSPIARWIKNIDFAYEEPGYLALLILIAAFLALAPKDSCSFSPEGASETSATEHR